MQRRCESLQSKVSEVREFDPVTTVSKTLQPIATTSLAWLTTIGKSYGVVSILTLVSIWAAWWELRQSRLASLRLLELLERRADVEEEARGGGTGVASGLDSS
mmetsp:Transcript_126102/g.281765  ORF Transcript_126102/g.281765 Transcript_126102/m.281765 type:complete len:103 (-) Transcript_126102:46-354(-)